MSCSGVPLYVLCAAISDHFKVNILVFDDIKERLVYGDIKGVSLERVLDCISWFLDAEYVLRDGIYYIGSNSKVVLVLPSAGVDKTIENFFVDVSLKNIGDKVVIYGSEREVAKVRQVYDQIIERKICKVKLYVLEIQNDDSLEAGIDIDQSVKYAFSWQALASNAYNPVQTLAVSLYASLQLDETQLRFSSLIDTDLGLVSGEPLKLQVGEDVDRPVYSQSDYGDRVLSGYSTQKTGLLIDLSVFFDKDQWVLSFSVENSEAKTDLKKTLTTLKTTAILNQKNPVSVLAKLNAGKNTIEYEKGIPYLADVPYLGYCFRVSRERIMDRTLYFIVQLLEPETISTLPDRLPPGDLFRFRRVVESAGGLGGRGSPNGAPAVSTIAD